MMASQMFEPILIRSAKLSDVKGIAKLADTLDYPTSIEEIQFRLERLITQSDHIIYTAHLPDTLVAGWIQVGIADTLLIGRQAVVEGLVVDEQYRKLGIGRSLLQSGEQWARSQNCHAVLVRSNVIREEAHRFYEHLGYSLLKTQATFSRAL
ncbi:GNAT family N-acetyltransferase [Cyanobacteria bacterium FACHB-63]|nr:GNAT family N-acetyltransferase [Cyanobacteria bacterium FACHB-63]